MSDLLITKASSAFIGEERKIDHDPYVRLAWGVVWKAAEDVRLGSAHEARDATSWLLSDGYDLVDALGLHVDYPNWRAWIMAGCKTRRRVRKAAGWPVVKMPAFFPGFVSESKSLGDPGSPHQVRFMESR